MSDNDTPCELPAQDLPPEPTFEDFKNENGITFWWASDLMRMLGYKDMKSFQKVIDRGTKSLVALNIPHYENIIPVVRQVEGKDCQDFKLTRFASYLLTMNGDPKKPEVATAQAYFVTQTRKFEVAMANAGGLERMMIRDELTDGNKSLVSVAKASGVTNYAYFQDAGMRGLYNMGTADLKKKRKLSAKDNPADYMGRTELAANLFRVTQTEERIKNKGITGQQNLQNTHFGVGKEVRAIVQKNVGKSPEDLTQEKHLPQIKKEFKIGYKEMAKVDGTNKKKPK